MLWWRRSERAPTFAASTGSVQAFAPVADAVVAARAATTFAQVGYALSLPLRRWIVTLLIMTNTEEIVAARPDFLSILLLLSERYTVYIWPSLHGRFISIHLIAANLAALYTYYKYYLYLTKSIVTLLFVLAKSLYLYVAQESSIVVLCVAESDFNRFVAFLLVQVGRRHRRH
jgi:hypothetical protein